MPTTQPLLVRTAVRMVRQHFRTLGLELPASFTDQLDKLERALGDRSALRHDPQALAAAVADALIESRDPATDKAVLRHLALAELSGMHRQLDTVTDDRRAATLTDHAHQLLDQLAPVVADADEILVEAHERLPDLDLTNQHYVSKLKPADMALWGQARDATARLTVTVQAWTAIVNAAGLAHIPNRNRHAPLILADLDADQLRTLPDRTALAPAHAGHRLTLASPHDYLDRVDRVRHQQTQRDHAAAPA